MEIRNDTSRPLTIYIGDGHQEEPEMVKILLVNERCGIPDNVPGIISIKEH